MKLKLKPLHQKIIVGILVVGLLWALLGRREGLTTAPTKRVTTLPPTKAAAIIPAGNGSVAVPTLKGTVVIPTKAGSTVTVTSKPIAAPLNSIVLPTAAGSVVVAGDKRAIAVPAKPGGVATIAPIGSSCISTGPYLAECCKRKIKEGTAMKDPACQGLPSNDRVTLDPREGKPAVGCSYKDAGDMWEIA